MTDKAAVMHPADPQNSMKESSRRGFFARLAGVAATATALHAVPSLPARALEPTGPITPAEWYEEMRRLGWTAFAGDYHGRRMGVYEYGPRDASGDFDDYEAMLATGPARSRLNRRVDQSGDDFFDRASVWLWERGLRIDLIAG